METTFDDPGTESASVQTAKPGQIAATSPEAALKYETS
jgi:hypothetical protein